MTASEYRNKIQGLTNYHRQYIDYEHLRFLEQVGSLTSQFINDPKTTKEDLEFVCRTLLKIMSPQFIISKYKNSNILEKGRTKF